MNDYKVYKLTFPNNKVYIGQTKNTLKHRFGKNGIGYRNCLKVYNAIKKYGWDNIKKEILYDNLNLYEANELERKLITEYYKSNIDEYGYNIENGGNNNGVHSDETKRKISEGNKGKVVSEETREKLRKINKGKVVSEETREKLRQICKKSNMKRNQHIIEFNNKKYNLKELAEYFNINYPSLRMYLSKYTKLLGNEELAVNKMLKYYGEKNDKRKKS